MSFSDLIKSRFSCRAYQNRPVEEEKLLEVLEAGRLAPTACNFQPLVFIVIRQDENRRRLASAYNKEWFLNAPVIIAVCCDHSKAWMRSDGKKYGVVDAAIAMDHITLQAAELGLGTCWIGAFNETEARSALNLPFQVEPIAFTPLGYPAVDAPTKVRQPLEALVRWERY